MRFTVKRGQLVLDKRTDKVDAAGKAVYEKVPVRELSGFITGVIKPSVEKHTLRTINGVQTPFFVLLMKDGDERYALEIQAGGNLASSLLKFLNNIEDFSKRVLIRPYARIGTGADGGSISYTNFYVEYDGEKLAWDPSWPKAERVTLSSGKVVVDDGAVKEAQKKCLDKIVEATKLLHSKEGQEGEAAEAEADAIPFTEEEPVPAPTVDDIPPAGDWNW